MGRIVAWIGSIPLGGRRFKLIAGSLIIVLLAGGGFTYLRIKPTASQPASGIAEGGGADQSPGAGLTDGSTTSVVPGTSGSSGGTSGTAGRAGTAGSGGKPGSAGSGVGPGGVKNTASDVGVTPTVIKVGILRPNAPGDPPVPDPNSPSVAFAAYVKDVNSHGGINGRVIQVYDEPFIPPKPDDRTRACIDLTENKKVFAVLNEGYFEGPCVAKDHHTFYSHLNGGSDQDYADAGGLDMSANASAQKQLRNLVDALDNRGDSLGIRGAVVGTVEDDNPTSKLEVDQGLAGPLQSRGHKVVRSPLNLLANDPSAVGSAVQSQMSQGVTAVVLVSNPFSAGAFIDAAGAAGFHPRYYTSDVNSMAQDELTGGMPAGFDGAVGLTSSRTGEVRAGFPEPGIDATCRSRFKGVTGKDLDRHSNDYAFMERYCGLVNDFVAAANLAGPNLTRAGLSNAYRSLAGHAYPFSGDISYGPTKFTGGDSQRLVQWHVGKSGCDGGSNGCYKPLEPGFTPYRV